MQPKFVVVVGGVCSSLGKGVIIKTEAHLNHLINLGVTSSSLGAVLRANGYRVTAIKIDPYINVDAGFVQPSVAFRKLFLNSLMSPFEHGEVYVLDDGGVCPRFPSFNNEPFARRHFLHPGQIWNLK